MEISAPSAQRQQIAEIEKQTKNSHSWLLQQHERPANVVMTSLRRRRAITKRRHFRQRPSGECVLSLPLIYIYAPITSTFHQTILRRLIIHTSCPRTFLKSSSSRIYVLRYHNDSKHSNFFLVEIFLQVFGKIKWLISYKLNWISLKNYSSF